MKNGRTLGSEIDTSYFNWKFLLKNGRTLGLEIDTSFFNWNFFFKNGRTLGLEIDTSYFNRKFFLKKLHIPDIIFTINIGESYRIRYRQLT